MPDQRVGSNMGKSSPMERAEFVTSALGLLAAIDPWRDEVLDRFEALNIYCAEHNCSWAEAENACGIPLDPQLIAVSISAMIRNWLDGGAQQMVHLKDHLMLREWAEGTESQRFAWNIAGMLEPLAHIELDNGFDELTLLAEAAVHCRNAAGFALKHGFADAALAALNASAVLTLRAGLPIHLELSREALQIARSVGDRNHTARQSLRHAGGMYAAARRGDITWTEALDSFESALRNPPADEETFKECMGGIIAAARTDELRALRPWVGMMAAGVPPEIADRIEGLHAYTPLVFEGDAQMFLERLQRLVEIVQMAEDERIKMLGTGIEHKARADWATWSLRHDSFRSAIPHANSFLRERDQQQLMLVLNHELTHILSMSSGVGLAIIAMRSALTQIEIELWTHGVGDDVNAAIAGLKSGLAPLARDDIRTLAMIERELEIMLKLRVLQDIWAPWFEGIAIAQELADPRDDADTHQPAMSVLMGMVDGAVQPDKVDTKASHAAKVTEYFQRFEVAYGEAVAAQGPARQRSYLTPPDSHTYLPAIIAIRSIVAGWRRMLGQSLAGTLASRILMHVTRFGTNECLPDLALPFTEFRDQAIRLHVEWVKWVARLRADQLEATLDLVNEGKPGAVIGGWRGGELVHWNLDNQKTLEEEFDTRLQKFALQAYASLTAPNAPVDRVPKAGDECRAILQQISNRMVGWGLDTDLVKKFSDHYLGLLRVLPIGEVDGPFWLLPRTSSFYVHIRTTEKHYRHGEPSYNGMLIPLAQLDFEALQKEVRRLGHARMRVTRFVDLVSGGVADGRGFGRHVLVFEYGEWRYLLPAGLLLGSSDITDSLRADIEDRLRSSPLGDLDMRFLSDGAENARRARTWLDGIKHWTLGDMTLPIEPWADHVRFLADELDQHTGASEREHVGAELLRLVLGTDVPAKQAMQEGLRALRSDEEASSGEGSRLLFAVGRAPVPLSEAPESVHWQTLFARSDKVVDVVPPAFLNTKGEIPCR